MFKLNKLKYISLSLFLGSILSSCALVKNSQTDYTQEDVSYNNNYKFIGDDKNIKPKNNLENLSNTKYPKTSRDIVEKMTLPPGYYDISNVDNIKYDKAEITEQDKKSNFESSFIIDGNYILNWYKLKEIIKKLYEVDEIIYINEIARVIYLEYDGEIFYINFINNDKYGKNINSNLAKVLILDEDCKVATKDEAQDLLKNLKNEFSKKSLSIDLNSSKLFDGKYNIKSFISTENKFNQPVLIINSMTNLPIKLVPQSLLNIDYAIRNADMNQGFYFIYPFSYKGNQYTNTLYVSFAKDFKIKEINKDKKDKNKIISQIQIQVFDNKGNPINPVVAQEFLDSLQKSLFLEIFIQHNIDKTII